MTQTVADVLVGRIDRLERQNRRFRRAATAIALGVAAVFLMGQTVPKSPAVETQKLVLKDKRGKIRAVLGAFSEDEPFGLLVFDANQRRDVTKSISRFSAGTKRILSGRG